MYKQPARWAAIKAVDYTKDLDIAKYRWHGSDHYLSVRDCRSEFEQQLYQDLGTRDADVVDGDKIVLLLLHEDGTRTVIRSRFEIVHDFRLLDLHVSPDDDLPSGEV